MQIDTSLRLIFSPHVAARQVGTGPRPVLPLTIPVSSVSLIPRAVPGFQRAAWPTLFGQFFDTKTIIKSIYQGSNMLPAQHWLQSALVMILCSSWFTRDQDGSY